MIHYHQQQMNLSTLGVNYHHVYIHVFGFFLLFLISYKSHLLKCIITSKRFCCQYRKTIITRNHTESSTFLAGIKKICTLDYLKCIFDYKIFLIFCSTSNLKRSIASKMNVTISSESSSINGVKSIPLTT